MNQSSMQRRVQIVSALVEGMGINAVCRMTGASKMTVLKLMTDVGHACLAYQDRVMMNLPCKRLEADEIWSFVGAKEKNVPREPKGFGRGDCYTWTVIDADTKLIPCWLVGTRDGACADAFIGDLAKRLANRVQLTTDGHSAYLHAVEKAFGRDVDYAMLVKQYGGLSESKEASRRYSPAEVTGIKKLAVTGAPIMAKVSTSYVERANLTMRMHMRRFTRLTNGFSKKMENHMHAISLHFMFYNFCKVHASLRVTPAMAAGLTDHIWELEEIIELTETMRPSGAVKNFVSSHA